MARATIRFHGSLNDFLPPGRRDAALEHGFGGSPAIKDAIEALGVPHPEVDRIVANGRSVGFQYRLRGGDRIDVYGLDASTEAAVWTQAGPGTESGPSPVAGPGTPTVAGGHGLIPRPPEPRRFVLDGHLGRLARYLRVLGFDTLYRNHVRDDELAVASARDGRVLLTRDRGLLKRSAVRLGYLVRPDDPRHQLEAVVARYGLAGLAVPFSRCVRCNGTLEQVGRAEVAERLAGEPRTLRYFDTFGRCVSCGAIYWKGSHFERMSRLVDRIVREGPPIVDNRVEADSAAEGHE